MIDFKSNKKAVNKVYNMDINSPSFPAYKKMVMDSLEVLNFILSVIRKKENQKLN